jgi:hypothetical protein
MRATRLLPLTLVALGACHRPAPTAPLANQGGAAPPPAATMTYDGAIRRFAVKGLPARRADGQLVVVRIAEDGGRGNPNLAVEIRDREDRVVETLPVLTVAQADADTTERGLGPAAAARLAAANQALATATVTPLPALAITPDPDEPSTYHAVGGGMAIAWTADGHLAIHADDGTLVERDGRAWLVADQPMCDSCTERCSNPAFLADAWGDAASAVAVVRIAYKGTDTCWEPDSQVHVVTWGSP